MIPELHSNCNIVELSFYVISKVNARIQYTYKLDYSNKFPYLGVLSLNPVSVFNITIFLKNSTAPMPPHTKYHHHMQQEILALIFTLNVRLHFIFVLRSLRSEFGFSKSLDLSLNCSLSITVNVLCKFLTQKYFLFIWKYFFLQFLHIWNIWINSFNLLELRNIYLCLINKLGY